MRAKTLIVVAVVAFAIAFGTNLIVKTWRSAASAPPVRLAFDIRPTHFGCLRYKLESGERFGNFYIGQPMWFDARDTQNVTLHDIEFDPAALCRYRDVGALTYRGGR